MPSDHARVAAAIAHLARTDPPPSLAEVAAEVGLGPHHFQRMFRRLTGISPKRFGQALAADRAERHLAEAGSVLEAARRAGLSGPGRLHDLVVQVRAMTPGELARGGAGLTIAHGVHETPLGAVSVGVTDRGIAHLGFLDAEDPLAALRARFPAAHVTESPARTAPVADGLVHASRRPGPPTLHLKGTNFQLQVWEALLSVPPGATTTYGALAAAVGRPAAARAVGGAVAANPVAVLIPCHRVLRAEGALGGYRWGGPRKRALLALEAGAAELR